MATLAQLIVKIGADITELQRGLDAANSRLERVAGSFQAALGPSQALLKATAGVSAGLFGVAAAGVKLAADMEQSRIAFTTMLGSAERADEFLRDLWSFAARTPFEFTGLQEASKQLLAFGFQAEQVIPMMTAVGNAVAGLGGGAEMIDRVTRALGQMQAKGKVSAQEMMQLAEAGIPAWEILAQKIGVSIPEAMKKAEKEGIPAAVAIQALIEGMNARFPDMMRKQSETLAGMWSTLRDNLTGALRSIGEQIVETFDLKAKLKSAIDALSRLNDLLSQKGLKGALQELIPPDMQAKIVGIAGAITGALMPAILALVSTIAKATWSLRAWMLAGTLLAEGAWYLYRNWDAVTRWFADAWAKLKVWVVRQIDGMLAAIQRLVGWIPGVASRIEAARAGLERYAKEEQSAIEARARAAAMAEAQSKSQRAFQKATEDSTAAVRRMTSSLAGGAAGEGKGATLSDAISLIDQHLEILRAKWDLWAEQNKRLEGSNEFLRARLAALKEQAAALEQAIAAVAAMKGKTAEETARLTLKHLELQKALAQTKNEMDALTESMKQQAAIPWRLPGTGRVIDLATKAGVAIFTALTGQKINLGQTAADVEEYRKAVMERLGPVKSAEWLKLRPKPFAEGGIVTRPTFALLGERGPEAVVPLNRAAAPVTVNVNITGNHIASDLDLRRLAALAADEVSRRIRQQRLAFAP